MKLNAPNKYPHLQTHEGAPAAQMTIEQSLRRSIMSCLLWESEFYEDGEEIAARIASLAAKAPTSHVAALAAEARGKFHLRHAPLLLASALAKAVSERTDKSIPSFEGSRVEGVVYDVIQRADELAEMIAIHAKINGVAPSAVKAKIPAAMKRGLARAFQRFDEYQLAKYDRAGAVRLRDVMRLAHPKPKDAEQAAMWKRLLAGELATPDTWEVALSGGADKRETFERLIREGNIGYLALLRNLRNMVEAGCELDLVRQAILARKNGAHRVLPFRFVAAARACPRLEPEIDEALLATISSSRPLPGATIVVVDVSGSMEEKLSAKGDLKRIDAAAALASVINAESLRVFSFSNGVVEVPPRRGMAGVDAVIRSQEHYSTHLGAAVRKVNGIPHDRLIVISDEQSDDAVPDPVAARAYMINVASARNGVGYGRWTHIDGFSENVIRFIAESEDYS
jgi:60 kDa SS-A/Ro ribonucleoprotein